MKKLKSTKRDRRLRDEKIDIDEELFRDRHFAHALFMPAHYYALYHASKKAEDIR